MKVTITAQLRNGLLWEGVQKLGSQRKLATYLGVPATKLGEWVNFKTVPDYSCQQRYRDKKQQIELKLMELLGYTWEEVFPPELKTEAFQKREKKLQRTLDVSPEQLAEAHLMDALPPAPDQIVAIHERDAAINESLGMLKLRHRQVLELRFGLNGQEEHTCKEVGEKLGFSTARAGQLEREALRKIRHPRTSRILKQFINEQMI